MNLFWRESKRDRLVFGVFEKYFSLALSQAGLRADPKRLDS